MDKRRDVFQAIADPTRRKILGMLAQKSLKLNDVAENFEISRPAISRHIKILSECGLIEIKEEGRERICQANLSTLASVDDWIKPYRVFWATRMDALENLLSKKVMSTSKNKNK